MIADHERVDVHLDRSRKTGDVHEQDAHESDTAYDIDGGDALALRDGAGGRLWRGCGVDGDDR